MYTLDNLVNHKAQEVKRTDRYLSGSECFQNIYNLTAVYDRLPAFNCPPTLRTLDIVSTIA